MRLSFRECCRKNRMNSILAGADLVQELFALERESIYSLSESELSFYKVLPFQRIECGVDCTRAR